MEYETNIGEYLCMCSVCGAIRIDDDQKIWLNLRDIDRNLYMSILEKYPKDKITHSLCPTDYKKRIEELERLKEDG